MVVSIHRANLLKLSRCFFHLELPKKLTFAVIGSGPAAMFTVNRVLKKYPQVKFDILEKLPVPYGLVRYGVAPDHQDVKNCINIFEEIFSDNHHDVSFYGNVSIPGYISLDFLKKTYSGIIFAYGASEDKKLGIPGEDKGEMVFGAKDIVAWYNGHPDHVNMDLKMTNVKTVAIIGNGNVAIDIARIFCSPYSILESTDITQYSLAEIFDSDIDNVHVIARRGPLQAAFTTAEFRKLTAIPSIKVNINIKTIHEAQKQLEEASKSSENSSINHHQRSKSRMLKLLSSVASDTTKLNSKKTITFHFWKSPKEILLKGSSVEGIKLEHTMYDGKNGSMLGTGKTETIPVDMVIRSIGYKSVAMPGIPYDHERNTILTDSKGHVVNKNGEIQNGMYATGWIRTGPVGNINSTMMEAKYIGETIIEDIANGNLEKKLPVSLRIPKMVSYQGWKQIDAFEKSEGKKFNKIREKMLQTDDMVKMSRSSQLFGHFPSADFFSTH